MDATARREIDQAVEGLLERVAAAVERDAKRFAPVDTGHLRDGIHAEEPRGNTVRVVAPADYAAYVEDGTEHMAAQPYLRPALYRERAL